MIILIPILITILLLLVGLYFLVRNDRVCAFRLYILDLNPNKRLACIELHEKYIYEQMLYSFKPLRLECWFTEEELKTIE